MKETNENFSFRRSLFSKQNAPKYLLVVVPKFYKKVLLLVLNLLVPMHSKYLRKTDQKARLYFLLTPNYSCNISHTINHLIDQYLYNNLYLWKEHLFVNQLWIMTWLWNMVCYFKIWWQSRLITIIYDDSMAGGLDQYNDWKFSLI